MKMEYLCPNCGKKVVERSGIFNAWMYGSKIRKCKKCDTEIFDNRWVEVAIQGFNPVQMKENKYSGIWFLCAILVAGLLSIWRYYELMYLNISTIVTDVIIATALLFAVYCLVIFIRKITGITEKANEKFMEESKARLQDEEYVKKLRAHGVKV